MPARPTSTDKPQLAGLGRWTSDVSRRREGLNAPPRDSTASEIGIFVPRFLPSTFHPTVSVMAATNASSQPAPLDQPVSTDELAAKAVNKRYEGLVMVRTKAVKGKGAWYWAYLEPVLVHNSDTGLPKAVKLRCSLCDAVFSASNPSRTASEHLKRGTCPNFSSLPKPISSLSPTGASLLPPPPGAASTPQPNDRKRSRGSSSAGAPSGTSYQ
ncbi:hypothetical protein CRG98_030109, partial [Punica granatum]